MVFMPPALLDEVDFWNPTADPDGLLTDLNEAQVIYKSKVLHPTSLTFEEEKKSELRETTPVQQIGIMTNSGIASLAKPISKATYSSGTQKKKTTPSRAQLHKLMGPSSHSMSLGKSTKNSGVKFIWIILLLINN